MPSRNSPRLLLTRPEPESRRLAAMLPEFEAVISPIMQIAPVAHDSARLRTAPGLVFTSANAVPFAGPGAGRPALCVGGRTARVAEEAGFKTRVGDGFAESLFPLIEASEVPLLHPHGRHLARQLPVEGVVVYDQIAVSLTKQAKDLLANVGPVFLPLYSPRSARLLADQLSGSPAELCIASISPAVAKAWHGPCKRHALAEEPTSEKIVAALRHLARLEQS